MPLGIRPETTRIPSVRPPATFLTSSSNRDLVCRSSPRFLPLDGKERVNDLAARRVNPQLDTLFSAFVPDGEEILMSRYLMHDPTFRVLFPHLAASDLHERGEALLLLRAARSISRVVCAPPL